MTFLSDAIALAVYTTHHRGVNNETVSKSLRSSLWKSAHDRWQIDFHQGTLVTD